MKERKKERMKQRFYLDTFESEILLNKGTVNDENFFERRSSLLLLATQKDMKITILCKLACKLISRSSDYKNRF
jgi:hypothetical protein